MITVKCDPD
ncbi:hypothetical protein A3Q56_00496, partial [Intoshia linei]